MWWKAIRIIPRLERGEWQQLDLVSRWLVATRAAVLLMTFISAAIAGLLALRSGQFDLGRWLLLVVGLIFAHATNNLLNDYTDYKRGVDKDNYFRTQYGPQPLQNGLMSERELLTYAAVTGLIAVAAGLPLVFFGGTTALLLMLAGAIFVLFYTWPLKYIGLGEVAVLLIWGPLMVGGGYYVITGTWDWNVVLASLPYALGPTTVLFGKHIDKLPQDAAKNIRTMPVLLGEKLARYVVLAMMALMYLLVVVLVFTGYFSPLMLIVLLALYTLPRVWRTYRFPKPEAAPAGYPENTWPLWFSAMSFYHNRAYGLLLLVGLVLGLMFR
jgi:1,4-dihydroxy-2-naphthoate octaprenyltransferase